MGFWNFIFGKKKEIIEDNFFGKLTVDNGYSESKQYFMPTNSFIELGLVLILNKPTDDQKVFYQLIEKEFDTLIPKFITVIENEFSKLRDDFKIVDFKKELILSGLNLSAHGAESIEWELYFDTIPNEKYYYSISISMNDFEVEDVIISY